MGGCGAGAAVGWSPAWSHKLCTLKDTQALGQLPCPRTERVFYILTFSAPSWTWGSPPRASPPLQDHGRGQCSPGRTARRQGEARLERRARPPAWRSADSWEHQSTPAGNPPSWGRGLPLSTAAPSGGSQLWKRGGSPLHLESLLPTVLTFGLSTYPLGRPLGRRQTHRTFPRLVGREPGTAVGRP